MWLCSHYGAEGRGPLVSVAWDPRTTVCLHSSPLPSWEPSVILFSGSGVISVAELGQLLEAIAKQGLKRPPANTVPLGEVGIFLA